MDGRLTRGGPFCQMAGVTPKIQVMRKRSVSMPYGGAGTGRSPAVRVPASVVSVTSQLQGICITAVAGGSGRGNGLTHTRIMMRS
jgi:hypothetical protein